MICIERYFGESLSICHHDSSINSKSKVRQRSVVKSRSDFKLYEHFASTMKWKLAQLESSVLHFQFSFSLLEGEV